MRSAKVQDLGRPRKEIRRDHQLNLSLTKEEYVSAYWKAERAGMKLVDYGRWRLLGSIQQPSAPENAVSRHEHLRVAELKRIGNNLNQLVRFCHATRQRPPANLEPLLQAIRALINRGSAE